MQVSASPCGGPSQSHENFGGALVGTFRYSLQMSLAGKGACTRVAHAASARPPEALPAQPEGLPALGAGRDLHARGPDGQLNVDLAAGDRGVQVDANLNQEIVAVAIKALVRLHLDADVEVAGRAAVAPC